MPERTATSGSRTLRTRDALRRAIVEGRFAGQTTLPGERQLADMIGVSRTTLRRALTALIDDGTLAQRRGYGTVVIDKPGIPGEKQTIGLSTLSFDGPGQRSLDSGEATSTRLVEVNSCRPDAGEAAALGIMPTLRVHRATRLLLSADEPYGLETLTMPDDVLGSVAPLWPDWPSTMERNGFVVVRCLERIRVAVLPSGVPTQLGLEPNTVGLILDHHGITAAGRCCGLWRMFRRLDGFDLVWG